MKEILTTIIIPTYNYANYISEAIDSVLNQNFPQNEIEIIVVDDGSTDNTSEVIARYKDRVIYIYQENSGKAWATKVGIDTARGRYIFNLDADDTFLSNKLQRVVEIFEKDREIVHVGHPAIYWYMNTYKKEIERVPDEIKGRKIYGRDLLSYFYGRKMLFGGGSTFAGRTEILKKFPIKKEIDMYTDEYLVLFTLNRGYSFFIDEPLSIWRIHGKNFSNLTKENLERNLRSMESVLSLVLKGDFGDEIKSLYLLKYKISQLVVKETFNQKSLSDVINLWFFILRHIGTFKVEIFKTLLNYTVLNRTLPTPMLRLLKRIKIVL